MVLQFNIWSFLPQILKRGDPCTTSTFDQTQKYNQLNKWKLISNMLNSCCKRTAKADCCCVAAVRYCQILTHPRVRCHNILLTGQLLHPDCRCVSAVKHCQVLHVTSQISSHTKNMHRNCIQGHFVHYFLLNIILSHVHNHCYNGVAFLMASVLNIITFVFFCFPTHWKESLRDCTCHLRESSSHISGNHEKVSQL